MLTMVVETACDCVNYLVYSSDLGCVHCLSLLTQYYVPTLVLIQLTTCV